MSNHGALNGRLSNNSVLDGKLDENAKYGRIIAMLLVIWLACSITAGKLLIFQTGSRYGTQRPIPLGLAVLLPLASFLLWFAASRQFRQFLLSLNPMGLTLAQTWRIGGITFVTLQVFHILPGIFAEPAGWGDFFVGLTAPFVAFYLARPSRKYAFIAWNVFGVLDLVNAIALGVLSSSGVGILRPLVSTDPMTVLPLSLIPTFAVPVLLIVHIILIAQALGWQTERTGAIATHVQPSIRGASGSTANL